MTAGDGHAGGMRCGHDQQLGHQSVNNLHTACPNGGNIIIQAGEGSSGNNTAGVGGEHHRQFQWLRRASPASTTFTAGNGGGGDGEAKVGGGRRLSGTWQLLGSGEDATSAT